MNQFCIMYGSQKAGYEEALKRILDQTSEDTCALEIKRASEENTYYLSQCSQVVLINLYEAVMLSHRFAMIGYKQLISTRISESGFNQKLNDVLTTVHKRLEMIPRDISAYRNSYKEVLGRNPKRHDEIMYTSLMVYAHIVAQNALELLHILEITETNDEDHVGEPD